MALQLLSATKTKILIIDELHKLDSYKIIFNDPIFYPDGAHPNREGHKVLYDFIKEKLNL